MTYADLKLVANGQNNRSSHLKSQQKGSKKWWGYIFILLFIVFVVTVFANVGKLKSVLAKAFNPAEVVASAVKGTKGKLKESDGRTNILLLGVDGRTIGELTGSQLTDSIMLVSVGKSSKDVALISVPRDLWVQSTTGGYYKINELYATFGGKEGTGTAEVVSAVERVLGIPVHYHAVINFTLFKEAIDILGGVEVYVENSFTDSLYPIEGMENAQPESARYETISFTQGINKMDGETALKYARSRHGDNGEGTDFARARRQQNLLKAVKDKALSSQTLLDFSKVKALYDLYAKNIDTDLDISSIQLFYELASLNSFSNMKSLVLDDRSETENGGLLYSPTDLTLYGGKYVLIPKTGDYSQIHAYIQKFLFD